LLSYLMDPFCFTRMARASSALESSARVDVPHSQSKVMSRMLGELDKPAQSARHKTLQSNDCMTFQALPGTFTANHEHRCKAMCSAACRVFLRAALLRRLMGNARSRAAAAHSAKRFMASNSQHSPWVWPWLSKHPIPLMSLPLRAP